MAPSSTPWWERTDAELQARGAASAADPAATAVADPVAAAAAAAASEPG